MNANEEIIEIYDNDIESIEQFRDSAIVISNISNALFIHTNIFNIKDQNIEYENNTYISDDFTSNEFNMVDVSLLTNKLQIDDIKLLTVNTLNPQIKITKEELKSLSNEIESLKNKDDCSFVVEDSSYGLVNRRKGEKLSYNQIKFLKGILSDTSIPVKEISKAYSVSSSILNRIKRTDDHSLDNNRVRDLTKIYGSQKQRLSKLIIEHINKTDTTLTAKEITEYANSSLNACYSVGFIRKFMKLDLKLTFKRVKSRPNNVNLLKIDSIRRLYSIKLSKSISDKTLLINIDESSINRGVKSLYSWSFKGIPNEKKNSSFSGSVSWILAICSNGYWIWFLLNKTIDSNNFIWFVKILHKWLAENKIFGYDKAILILDNWSTHKSELTKNLMKKLPYTVYYLPAYSPELAPVELCFGILKKSLSELCKNETIKLSLKYNYLKIYRSLSKLTWEVVKKIFTRNLKIIYSYLTI